MQLYARKADNSHMPDCKYLKIIDVMFGVTEEKDVG
jgi:hypothetical protein